MSRYIGKQVLFRSLKLWCCDILFLGKFIGAGAHAGCVYCNIQGEYLRQLNKMLYLQHQSLIEPHDPLHQENSLFPHRKDLRRPPKMKSMLYIDTANGRYVSASTAEQWENCSIPYEVYLAANPMTSRAGVYLKCCFRADWNPPREGRKC